MTLPPARYIPAVSCWLESTPSPPSLVHSGRPESLPRYIAAILAGWNPSTPTPGTFWPFWLAGISLSPPPPRPRYIPAMPFRMESFPRYIPAISGRLESLLQYIPDDWNHPPPLLAPGTFRPCQAGCNHLPVHSGHVGSAEIPRVHPNSPLNSQSCFCLVQCPYGKTPAGQRFPLKCTISIASITITSTISRLL